MKHLICSLTLLFKSIIIFSQIETSITIDTLKIIEQKGFINYQIEYEYETFDETIFLRKSDVINSFKTVLAELMDEDHFSEKDSTEYPYSTYLEVSRIIEYLYSDSTFYFEPSKAIGMTKDLEIHDLTDRYLSELICNLLNEGRVNFSVNSKLNGERIVKAKVSKTTKYYKTESIKYYVNGNEICTCPPIFQACYVLE